MDTLTPELQAIRDRLRVNTLDLETLSRYKPFLSEISGLHGVDEETVAHITFSAESLEHAEKRYRAIQKQIERRDKMELESPRNVPVRFRGASKADFRGDLWAKCLASPHGLYLTGKAGTGKTHLAVALLKEAAAERKEIYFDKKYMEFRPKNIYRPAFVSIPDLLMRIRATFKSEDPSITEEGIIKEYTGDSLVAFDDLGAEKTSEWSIQTLYTIIDQRYRDMKRTIITSNLSLDEVAEKVGDRIASRIAGMCSILTLSGKDRRVGRP